MHFTLDSGKPGVTVTSRCPICLAVTYHKNNNLELDDRTVCCSDDCAARYTLSLWALFDRAKKWAGVHDIPQVQWTALIERYLREVGE
jgi:hypothetical protein